MSAIEFILPYLREYGMLSLFFILWLGMFGIPVPNEAIVLSVGAISHLSILHWKGAFVVTYLGIISSLTTSYSLGRIVGKPLLHFLRTRKLFRKKVDRALYLLDKYGPTSLAMSYFLPGVRIFIPLLVGATKLPFHRFVIYAYSSALVWTILFFTFGYLSGAYFDLVSLSSFIIIPLFVFFMVLILIFIKRRKKERDYT